MLNWINQNTSHFYTLIIIIIFFTQIDTEKVNKNKIYSMKKCIKLHCSKKKILKSLLYWRNKEDYLKHNDLCHCKTAWHTPISAIQQSADHFWLMPEMVHPNLSKVRYSKTKYVNFLTLSKTLKR